VDVRRVLVRVRHLGILVFVDLEARAVLRVLRRVMMEVRVVGNVRLNPVAEVEHPTAINLTLGHGFDCGNNRLVHVLPLLDFVKRGVRFLLGDLPLLHRLLDGLNLPRVVELIEGARAQPLRGVHRVAPVAYLIIGRGSLLVIVGRVAVALGTVVLIVLPRVLPRVLLFVGRVTVALGAVLLFVVALTVHALTHFESQLGGSIISCMNAAPQGSCSTHDFHSDSGVYVL